MQNREEGLQWLSIAKEDLAVAKHLKNASGDRNIFGTE